MASNLMDYVAKYGEQPPEKNPFGPVDFLILSMLVYGPLEQLNPVDLNGQETLSEIFPLIYQRAPGREVSQNARERYALWKETAATKRFASLKLACFSVRFDQREQFAAAMFLCDTDGIVVYRGTDGTLVGWHEDFVLSFEDVIPAQRDAAAFLTSCARKAEKLILCGHSKGGNLAMYSAVTAAERIGKKIQKVYSFDGPGLCDRLLDSAGMRKMKDRIVSYIPEASIVGRMLGTCVEPIVVASDSSSIMQHNPFRWHVSGSGFEIAQTTTIPSAYADRALHDYLKHASPETRKIVVETGFRVLEVCQAPDLHTLPSSMLWHAPQLVEAVKSVPQDEKNQVREGLRVFFGALGANLPLLLADALIRNLDKKNAEPAKLPENNG